MTEPPPTKRPPLGPWVYPLVLLAHFALYFALVSAGLATFFSYGVVAAVLMTAALCLERARPYCDAWRARDGQTAHDTFHLVVGSTLGGSLGRSVADALVLFALPAATHEAPRAGWPFAARVAAGLALAEAARYAWHWAQHHSAFLWRLHRLHHDAGSVTALKSGRAHLLSYAMQACATALPILALGLGFDALAACVCFQGLVGILALTNADFDERWVAGVLQSPTVHRLHHRMLTTRREKVNLAASFNALDRLAGTFEAPARSGERSSTRQAPYEVGADGPRVAGFFAQLLLRSPRDRRYP